MRLKRFLVGLAFSLPALSSLAVEKPSFEQYVQNLKAEAIDKGYSPEFVDTAFSQVKYLKRAVKADKNQPEFRNVGHLSTETCAGMEGDACSSSV